MKFLCAGHNNLSQPTHPRSGQTFLDYRLVQMKRRPDHYQDDENNKDQGHACTQACYPVNISQPHQTRRKAAEENCQVWNEKPARHAQLVMALRGDKLVSEEEGNAAKKAEQHPEARTLPVKLVEEPVGRHGYDSSRDCDDPKTSAKIQTGTGSRTCPCCLGLV